MPYLQAAAWSSVTGLRYAVRDLLGFRVLGLGLWISQTKAQARARVRNTPVRDQGSFSWCFFGI